MADIFGAFEPMNERSEVCGGREVTMGGGVWCHQKFCRNPCLLI